MIFPEGAILPLFLKNENWKMLQALSRNFMIWSCLPARHGYSAGRTRYWSQENCAATTRKGAYGVVAERFKAHAWKACWVATPSRVRIPPTPPVPSIPSKAKSLSHAPLFSFVQLCLPRRVANWRFLSFRLPSIQIALIVSEAFRMKLKAQARDWGYKRFGERP